MTSFLAPVVPIRSLTLDAAHAVLKECRPSRQQQVLPYLVALYTFIDWWEHEGVLSKTDDWEDVPPQLTLSTTWCERPDVLDLLDIADLNLEGVQLALYPVEQGKALEIHCPTFLGVVNADIAVAVALDRDRRWARILGFSDRQTLVNHWQQFPANAQGFGTFPLEQLQPIYYLAEQISFLTPLPEAPPKAAPTKGNTYGEPLHNIPELAALLQTLESEPPLERSSIDQAAVQRLLQALQQGYGTPASETPLSRD